jgi:hypothetical protein
MPRENISSPDQKLNFAAIVLINNAGASMQPKQISTMFLCRSSA